MAILALGGFDFADRAAVDAGGGDTGEKTPVKARVAGLEREVENVLRGSVGGGGHPGE